MHALGNHEFGASIIVEASSHGKETHYIHSNRLGLLRWYAHHETSVPSKSKQFLTTLYDKIVQHQSLSAVHLSQMNCCFVQAPIANSAACSSRTTCRALRTQKIMQ